MVDYKAVLKFIAKRKVCVLGMLDKDGCPVQKAVLAPRKIEDGKYFYFSTNTSSQKIAQYLANPNASIYFYRKGLVVYRGVMLKGTMEVKTDAETKQSIWHKGDTMYYRQGVTDPDYCVLKFTATSGRHYANLKTEDFDIG